MFHDSGGTNLGWGNMTLNIENFMLLRSQGRIVAHQKLVHKLDIVLRSCPKQTSQLQYKKPTFVRCPLRKFSVQ